MTGRKLDEDYAETHVLPGTSRTEDPDTDVTVVLGDEYSRRVERSDDPESDSDA